MFCTKCGREMNSQNFCTFCGNRIPVPNSPKKPSFFSKHKVKILIFSLLLIIIAGGSFVGYRFFLHNQMSQIRTFYGVTVKNIDGNTNDTYKIKQDGYGKIYEYEVYDNENELIVSMEYEYSDDNRQRKVISYNGDIKSDYYFVDKYDKKGKNTKRLSYNNDELTDTNYFLEGDTKKNIKKAKENTDYIIVEYDKFNRPTLWKSFDEDGTEHTYVYEYDKYGMKKEIYYRDNVKTSIIEYELDE